MEYIQKNMGLKWFFCLQINMKVFYKVIVFWMCVTKLAQSTQSKKFAIYLQYLKENGKNEVDFLLLFCKCYLAAPRPTLGHSQEDNLTNLMLITAFVQVPPKGHREPHNEVAYLSLAECLEGFDWEPSNSDCNLWTHQATLPKWTDKHQRFLQNDIIIVGVCVQACPNYPK